MDTFSQYADSAVKSAITKAYNKKRIGLENLLALKNTVRVRSAWADPSVWETYEHMISEMETWGSQVQDNSSMPEQLDSMLNESQSASQSPESGSDVEDSETVMLNQSKFKVAHNNSSMEMQIQLMQQMMQQQMQQQSLLQYLQEHQSLTPPM